MSEFYELSSQAALIHGALDGIGIAKQIELMLFAGMAGKDGRLPSIDEIACELRCEAEQLETEMNELAGLGLLSIVDGRYYLADWPSRGMP